MPDGPLGPAGVARALAEREAHPRGGERIAHQRPRRAVELLALNDEVAKRRAVRELERRRAAGEATGGELGFAELVQRTAVHVSLVERHQRGKRERDDIQSLGILARVLGKEPLVNDGGRARKRNEIRRRRHEDHPRRAARLQDAPGVRRSDYAALLSPEPERSGSISRTTSFGSQGFSR